ncbi:MAG: hypothetical protein GY943_14100 [Chloroflexi bacterium]|nr:hypothetical protein [Chloroflexota bacterium]
MKNKPSQPQPELGVLSLMLALILLGALAYIFADATGERYEDLGTLIWIIITVVAFIFGLLYFAQFVLPQRDSEGWAEGLRLLGRYYFSSGQQYIQATIKGRNRPRKRQRRSKKGRAVPDPAIIPHSFKTLQAGVVRGEQAITIHQGNRYIRPGGPGFTMLYRREKADQMLDLRPQLRSQPVFATTRDGIPIDTAVTVSFRIRQNTQPNPIDRVVHPYDRDVLFLVSSYSSIDEDGTQYPWTEQLAPLAASELSDELSKYLVDELQQSTTPPDVRDEMQQRIQRKLGQIAYQNGLELRFVGIGPFKFPSQIVEQRIKTWQADWQRKIEVRHAEGDAEAVRRIKKARAYAQIEIIEKITESIDTIRQHEHTNLTEIITLRMIEALEEATTNNSVQGLIPQQVMTNLVLDASNQMQAWMQRQSEDES